jgi:hypothetical protein
MFYKCNRKNFSKKYIFPLAIMTKNIYGLAKRILKACVLRKI